MAKFKYWLWNWVFSYLTKPVKLDHIIKVNELGQVWMDGRLLLPNEIANLQEQVRAFNSLALKSILFNTPKSLAEDTMFKQAGSMDDLINGKNVLYTIDIQEQILQKILNAPQGNQVAIQPNPYRK